MGLIPLGDATRRPVNMPVVTASIIVVNVLVFALEIASGDAFVARWAVIPAEIASGHHLITILTAMFMHGSWSHLIGNMIFLWAFGPEIEDAMGRARYLVFYLAGGLAATLAQVVGDPLSTIPNLGASGAIAGVMGAFLVTYPRDRIRTVLFVFVFARIRYIPAALLIGVWFISQIFNAGVVAQVQTGGVAYLAHIGGFIWGAVSARLFDNRGQIALLALAAVLCLGASAPDSTRGSSRDAAPPPSPKFDRPADAMFADDFADSDLKGWHADQPAAWSVRSGALRADLPDEKQAHSFLYAGDSSWVDYAVDLDVCGMRGVDRGLAVRVQPGKKGLGIDLRGPGYEDLKLYVNELPVGGAKVANGNGTWHHMRVEIRGNDCTVRVGGKVVFDHGLRHRAPRRGGIALSAYTGGLAQCTVYYDNVVVTPLATETPSKPD